MYSSYTYPSEMPQARASSTTRGIINGHSNQTTPMTGTSGSGTPASSSVLQQQHRGPSPYTSATYPLDPSWMSPVPWQGTFATHSPALGESASTTYDTESYDDSEASTNDERSAAARLPKKKLQPGHFNPNSKSGPNQHQKSNPKAKEHQNLSPDKASSHGLGLGIGANPSQDQKHTQAQADERLPELQEWPMLVEWVCNDHPVKVFRDSEGAFAISSFLASSLKDTERSNEPPFLSITQVNAAATCKDILERLELSRSIGLARGEARRMNGTENPPPVKTVSLAFKSMKVRFDIPGGRTGEVLLLPLDAQEVKEVWDLVLARGRKDILVVEYEMVDEEASAAATEMRGPKKEFSGHKQAEKMRQRFQKWVSGRGDGKEKSAIV